MILAVAFIVQHAAAQSGTTNLAAAGKLSINAPRPEYPHTLAVRGIGGRGVVRLSIDPKTGQVTRVRMLETTGYNMLDESAMKAFRQWRFRPGTVPEVTIPIEFNAKASSRP